MEHILPALIGILIIPIYAFLVLKKAPNQIWSFWHTLISSIVSILLGVSVALLLFYHQQSTINEETRDRYVNFLQLELSDIQKSLKDCKPINISTPSGNKKSHVTFLYPIIMADAAKSGLFSKEISWQILQVSTSIQAYNAKVQILLNLFSSSRVGPGMDTNVDAAIENIEGSRGGILKGIKILCQDAGIELINNIGTY